MAGDIVILDTVPEAKYINNLMKDANCFIYRFINYIKLVQLFVFNDHKCEKQ